MLGAIQIKITKNCHFLNDCIIKTLLFILSEIKRNWGGDGKKGYSSDIQWEDAINQKLWLRDLQRSSSV